MVILHSAITGSLYFQLLDIYKYLELVSRKWWPQICSALKDLRVMAINRRKVENIDEEDCFSFFKIGLWQMRFSNAAKSGTIFHQELMVSQMVV